VSKDAFALGLALAGTGGTVAVTVVLASARGDADNTTNHGTKIADVTRNIVTASAPRDLFIEQSSAGRFVDGSQYSGALDPQPGLCSRRLTIAQPQQHLRGAVPQSVRGLGEQRTSAVIGAADGDP